MVGDTQNNVGVQAPPKRKIVLADVAGFCFGVRRAVDIVRMSRRERPGTITTLGPLIHNEQVTRRLQEEGVRQASHLDDITEGTVVLSAHGVSPRVRQEALERGLEVIDVTCPFVTKVHRMAKQLLGQGYQLLLVGDHGHTEVKGVVGAVGGAISVVSHVEELRQIRLGHKVGVIAQTTQKAETFAAIVGEVAKRVGEVRAINTICGATDELQEAARRLAREVDVVLVIGGHQSANTRRLRETCEQEGVPAYHIETKEEIQATWLEGKEVIGVTAGASTPDWLIEEIIAYLNGGELPANFRLKHPDE
jgi:4-hydroxy-3-methylbut-2-enyl diphosphate reductase